MKNEESGMKNFYLNKMFVLVGFYLNARFSYPNIPPKNAHY